MFPPGWCKIHIVAGFQERLGTPAIVYLQLYTLTQATCLENLMAQVDTFNMNNWTRSRYLLVFVNITQINFALNKSFHFIAQVFFNFVWRILAKVGTSTCYFNNMNFIYVLFF